MGKVRESVHRKKHRGSKQDQLHPRPANRDCVDRRFHGDEGSEVRAVLSPRRSENYIPCVPAPVATVRLTPVDPRKLSLNQNARRAHEYCYTVSSCIRSGATNGSWSTRPAMRGVTQPCSRP